LFREVIFEVVEFKGVVFEKVVELPVALSDGGARASAEEGVAGFFVVFFVSLEVDGEVPV